VGKVQTRRRKLLPASGLVEELMSSPRVTSALLKELLVGQYQVAKLNRGDGNGCRACNVY